MYKITSYETGEILGMTEEVRYITWGKSECFVQTDAANAKGVAYQSQPYNLVGRESLGEYPYVVVSEVDSGELSADIRNLQDELATTDDATIELYENSLQQDSINSEQDDSIIQLYEMIGGN